jgi:hypothetical protein
MAVKQFSVSEVLTASDTNTFLANSGLVYITSATVGTGVSSVAIASCFNSTFNDYFVLCSGITYSVGDTTLSIKPDGVSTANYFGGGYFQQYGVATITPFTLSASTGGGAIGITSTVPATNAADIFAPYLTQQTKFVGRQSLGAAYTAQYQSILATTNSYTGFTLLPSSGTMTGGTITVYGYRKA